MRRDEVVFMQKLTHPEQELERPALARWRAGWARRSLQEREEPRSPSWERPQRAGWLPSPVQQSWTPELTGWPPALSTEIFNCK